MFGGVTRDYVEFAVHAFDPAAQSWSPVAFEGAPPQSLAPAFRRRSLQVGVKGRGLSVQCADPPTPHFTGQQNGLPQRRSNAWESRFRQPKDPPAPRPPQRGPSSLKGYAMNPSDSRTDAGLRPRGPSGPRIVPLGRGGVVCTVQTLAIYRPPGVSPAHCPPPPPTPHPHCAAPAAHAVCTRPLLSHSSEPQRLSLGVSPVPACSITVPVQSKGCLPLWWDHHNAGARSSCSGVFCVSCAGRRSGMSPSKGRTVRAARRGVFVPMSAERGGRGVRSTSFCTTLGPRPSGHLFPNAGMPRGQGSHFAPPSPKPSFARASPPSSSIFTATAVMHGAFHLTKDIDRLGHPHHFLDAAL